MARFSDAKTSRAEQGRTAPAKNRDARGRPLENKLVQLDLQSTVPATILAQHRKYKRPQDAQTQHPVSKYEKSHLGHLSWVCDALRRMQLRLGAHGVDIALYCSRVDAVGLPLETLLGHNGFHRKAVVIGPGDPARGHGGNVLSPQRPNSCEWLKLAQANAEPLQTL